jgi:multiple sugar transport system permease protein
LKRGSLQGSILGKISKSSVLLLLGLIFFLPILVTVLTSIRSNADILKNGLWSVPDPFHLGGFSHTWTYGKMSIYIRNSFIITIPSMLGSLFCSSLAAHAITRFRFRLRNVILILFFAGLWFPPQTFLVPVYFLTTRLGIYDTYLGLIFVHIAYGLPFGVLVLSRFFQAIPFTIIEAARMDGASEVRILAQIVWPLALPALGSVAIFQFTWMWNDFYWGLVMTQSPQVQPVMIGMTATLGRYVFDWNGQSAGSIIAMLPPLLLFIFLQRFFIEGVRMGSGK